MIGATIESKARFVFNKIKHNYGSQQLELLRICLQSVTVLARLSRMAGVTAQQIMRRKYKILVRHVQSGGKYQTEVHYDGKVVSELPDDCLATNTYYQTAKIYRSLPGVLLEYPLQPAYASLPGKNVLASLAAWNRDQFETDLLPVLEKVTSLNRQVQVYKRVRDGGDEATQYELYDVLVRLYVYAREHNIAVVRNGIEGLKPITAVEGLTASSPDCIILEDCFAAALRVIHKDHVEVDHEGVKYLVSSAPISPMRSVCGDVHQDLHEEQIKTLLTAGDTMEAVKITVQRGGVDCDTKEGWTGLAARILGQGGVPVTPEEKDLVAYRDVVVAQGLVGKNAMVGLGKIIGEGPLSERLDVGFQEVCKRARHLDAECCYKLAASRLAGMNSAKTVAQERGVLVIRDRLSGSEVVGGLRLTQ